MFECADSRVDWATAELLAFGTMVCHHERTDLIEPGPPTVPHFHVRLSGQVLIGVTLHPTSLSHRVHLARSTTGLSWPYRVGAAGIESRGPFYCITVLVEPGTSAREPNKAVGNSSSVSKANLYQCVHVLAKEARGFHV